MFAHVDIYRERPLGTNEFSEHRPSTPDAGTKASVLAAGSACIRRALAVLKVVSNGIPYEKLSDELLDLVARRLQAIAEPTRIRLLTRLERENATVQELTDELPMTPQNVSWHLTVLYKAGLVTRRKEGKCVRYALSDYTACRLVEQARACVGAYVEELAQITSLTRD